MKRIIKLFLITIFALCFIQNVYATENSVQLAGKNVFGRTLDAKTTCSETYRKYEGSETCNVRIQWFINDSNSTTGGTEINMTDSENTYYSNYQVEREYLGKYVYVKATFVDRNGEAPDVVVYDITDDQNTDSATITGYIKRVNNNNYGFTVNIDEGYVVADLNVQLTGITDQNADYYIWFQDSGEINIDQNNYGCDIDNYGEGIDRFHYVTSSTGSVSLDYDWFMLNGYDKAYVIKEYYDRENGGTYCEITKQPITMERPGLFAAGTNYDVALFTDEEYRGISTIPRFPHYGSTGSHIIINKIGRITDNELLRKLSKNEAGAYDQLLTYAKNNPGSTFTSNERERADIGSFSVVDGAYYFVYTTYQNLDNKYRDLSDVAVVQGRYTYLVTDIDWSGYNTTDVKWNAFVDHFKNDSSVKSFNSTITSTDSSLTAVYKEGDYTYTYTVSYANGIVTFTTDSEEDKDAFMNSVFNGATIKAFAQVYNYNEDKLIEYISEHPVLTVANDGVEYTAEDFTYLYTVAGNSIRINSQYYKSLKLDLAHGLQNYTETNDPTPPASLTWTLDKSSDNGTCTQETVKIYSDKNYDYFVANSCKAGYKVVFSNGESFVLKDALTKGKVTIAELEKTGVEITRNPKTGALIPVFGGVILLSVLGVVLLLKRKRIFY